MKNIQTLYFHPTTIVIIDDNKSFTDLLLYSLSRKANQYQVFNNPLKSLKYLQQYQEHSILNNIIYFDEDNENKINFNPQEIYYTMLNHTRFDKISTVFIDYEMHGATGLEILEQIQDKKFAKVLLTGVADEKIAINAFNEGLIDKYIKKHDPNFTQIVLNVIGQNNLSSFQIDNFRHLKCFKILNSAQYSEFLNSLIKKYNIIEYYICDIHGSTVIINEEGKIRLLCVREESQVKELLNYAKLENYPEDQLKALKLYQKQICFIEDITMKSENINDSIYDANSIIIDNELYLYSIIDNISSELNNKITSFRKYQNE